MKRLLLFLIASYIWPFAFAEENTFHYAGLLQIDYKHELQPSSQKNHNAFSLPFLRLNFGQKFEQDLGFEVGLQAGPMDSTSGEYRALVRQGYVYLLGAFVENDEVQYGAIVNSWIDHQETVWGLQDTSGTSDVLLKRYSYLPRVDLGVKYLQKGEAGQWSFSIVNGEGLNAEDGGVKKDGFLHFEWLPFSSLRTLDEGRFFISGGYLYGAYDGVAENLSVKERSLLSLGLKQNLGLSFWIEGYQGKDAVDKITGKVADKVDLSGQGGTLAKSEGATGALIYSFQRETLKRWQVVLRGDWLNPYKGVDGKWVRSQVGGVTYQPRNRIQVSLMNSRAQYGENHSVGKRESENWNFSTRVIF